MNRKSAALLRSMGAVLCFSVAPLMIRGTREHFTVMFQTFARYGSALVVLWPLLILGGRGRARRDLLSILPLLPRILVLAVVNYAFQSSFTLAYYALDPGFGSLVSQSGVLFGVMLAVIFFPEERHALRSSRLRLGLIAAVAGVLLTVLGGRGIAAIGAAGSPVVGVLAMLSSSFCWALLGTLVKRWLAGVNPLFALSAIFTIVTPLFLLTDVLLSGGLHLPVAPVGVWVVVVLSGLTGVGLGHSLYYSAVPVVGVTVSSSLGLLTPLLAGVLSLLLFGERLAPLQLVGGPLLLGGCFVVIRERTAPAATGRSGP